MSQLQSYVIIGTAAGAVLHWFWIRISEPVDALTPPCGCFLMSEEEAVSIGRQIDPPGQEMKTRRRKSHVIFPLN